MAQKLFYVDINLNGNVIKNVAIESLATAPENPEVGRIYFNSTTGKLMYHDGTKWVCSDADAAEAAAKSYADGLIAALDASDAAVEHQFVTAVSEADGIITVTRTQPAAGDVAVTAIQGVTGTDLQTVLESLKALIDAGGSGSVVDVEKQQTAESGYAATYVVKQGGVQVGVKINIPKDYLVKSASIETVVTPDVPYEGAQVGDKYIDFVVNAIDASETAQHIYLPVNDLVDVYTAGDGLALSNQNVFSIDLDPNSEAFLSIDSTSKKLKLSGVQSAINSAANAAQQAAEQTAATALQNAIQALDADVDASGTPAAGGVMVIKGITEADGVITSVDSQEVEQAGAAAAAKAIIDAYTINGKAISTNPSLSAANTKTELAAQSSGVQITTPFPGTIQAFDSNGNEVEVQIAYNKSTGVATVSWNGSATLDIVYLTTAVTLS